MSHKATTTATFFMVFAFLILGNNFKKREKSVLNGDLYFPKIAFASFYGATDSMFQALTAEMDSALASDENVAAHELEAWQHFDRLRDYDLLRKPYLYLRKEDGSNLVIYLSESEYEKVKNFERLDLVKAHHKVSLILEVDLFDSLVYYSDNIIELKVVDGQTFPDREPIDWL